MSDLFTLGMALDTSQVKKGTKDLDGVTKSATNAEKNLKGVTTASKQTGGAFKSLQGQAANVGYQLQDIAVQAQMGTNAFVIMAQQGGQLLSPFSAVAGVLATVAGVAGGLLYSNLGNATEAAKDFNSEIELLSQTVSVNEMGLVSFSDQFGKLANERPDVAISKIRTEMTRADSAARLLSQSVANVFEDEFGYDADGQIKYVTSLFNGLNLSVEQLDNALNGVDIGVEIPLTEITIFESEVDRLQSTFGITQAQAIKLAKSITGIKTPEGIVNLSSTVAEIASESGGANSKIDQLNVKMADWSVRADNTANSQQALNQSLFDVQLIAKQTESALDENSKANLSAAQAVLSLNQQIEIQKTAMEDGEAAAIRLATELSLGGNVSDELKEKVGNLAVEYYSLTEAQKEAEIQQRKFAEEQASTERNLQRISDKYNPWLAKERQLLEDQKALNAALSKASEQQLPALKNALEQIDGMIVEVQIEIKTSTGPLIPDANNIPTIFDEGANVADDFADVITGKLNPALKAMADINEEMSQEAFTDVFSGLSDDIDKASSGFDYMAQSIVSAMDAFSDLADNGDASAQRMAASIDALNYVLAGTAALNAMANASNVYEALAAGAAMATAVAGLGYSIGGITGGFESGAERRQEQQGAGTVLGDLSAKSESLVNAMESADDALSQLVGINSDGFEALKTVLSSITGASSLIARDVSYDGLNQLAAVNGFLEQFDPLSNILLNFANSLGGVGDVITTALNGLLGGKSRVSDEGLIFASGTISDVLSEGFVQAFAEVGEKKNIFDDWDYSTRTGSVSDQLSNQIALVFQSMADSVEAAANVLGIDATDAIQSYVFDSITVSLKDLTAEEQIAELEAVFSAVFDSFAGGIIPIAYDFQNAGEGIGETVTRLATNMTVTDEAIRQLGLNDLTGTSNEIIAISTAFAELTGGASDLAGQLNDFVSTFASDERQLEILTGGLTRALGEQDVAILNSRDGVYDYIASLERLDDGNADRIANILSLSGSLDDYFNLLEAVNEELISSTLDPAMASLNRAIDNERDQLRDSYETQREAAQNLLETLNEGFGDLEKVAGSLENAISSTVSMSAEVARSQLQSARNQIAAFADSGIIPDSDELNKLLSIVTGDNAKYYATAADYYRDQGRTANDIAFLSEIADEQLSEAEQQIKTQEGILEQLERQYQLDLDYLDSLLKAYQNEYDALMGIDVSILSVADAVAKVEAAINNLELISGGSVGSGVSSSEISSAYDYLQQQNTSSGMTDWDATDYQTGLAAINAGISSQELADSLGVSASYVQQRAEELGLPAFANGGTFSQGGLALVGERGPEIVNIPAGTHVSTAQQTGSLMDNSQLVGLVQELIDKTIVQNGYAKKSYDILNQVSTGGKSFNTDSVIVKTL